MLYTDHYGNVQFDRPPWSAPSVGKSMYSPTKVPYRVAPIQDEDYDDYDVDISTTKFPPYVRSTTLPSTTSSVPTTTKLYQTRRIYNGGYTNTMPVYNNNNYNSPLYVQPSFPESQPPRR